MTETTFCRICEALCGLEVDVEDGRATAVRPDPRHVATAGYACIKGLSQHAIYATPDRVTHPLKREGARFVRVSWDEALADIGARVRRLREAEGPDAIAMYVGTAAGFSVLHPIFAQGFMTGLGSRSMYSSATQDCASKFAVAREIYGFPFTQPFPDVDRVRCLVVVGANPAVSKWSFLQVPDPVARLRDVERRGGRLFFVDPRRTESAKAAGEHVFIRPDTDVFFYLAFLHELVRQGGVDRARLARFTTGFDEVARLAAPWTPERAAEVTRVPPDTLRRIVAAYREAGASALYCSTGVNMGSNGSLAFWIQEVINAASGNLDREGGTLVGRGIFDFAAFGKRTGTLMRSERSRLGAFRTVNDAFPGGLLADEITTPGRGRVRALFVTGGNPLLTMPGSAHLCDALRDLELCVSVDVVRNETAELAHYVLPATTPLERPDLPFVFPLFLGMQRTPYLQATRRVVPPAGEARDEATIYLDLCRAAGVGLFGSRVAQAALEAMKAVHSRRHPDEQPALPQEALLSLLLRVTGQPGFDALLRHPHGLPRPPHRAGDFLGRRVTTDDGLVHLAPRALVEAAEQRLEPAFERARADARRLVLITKRAVTTHNSWTHNHAPFVEGDRGENRVFLHPDDAARLGLADGALADVATATATVRLPVRLTADLQPGTVALPHGWGHQHAPGLSVASRTRGVNVNLLAADGPHRLEPVSGMAHLTGFVVDVRPAAGPRDVTSWSGIAP